MEANIYCNLTKDQASLYQAVVDDMMKQINSAAGIAQRLDHDDAHEAQAGLQSSDAAHQRQEGAGAAQRKLSALMTCLR